jgi:predicted RNA binding protein YcfA (HicA-like mRNA interferase family)
LPEATTSCVTPIGRGTTVPVHHGRDVAKGTLRGILSDADMTIEELQGLL